MTDFTRLEAQVDIGEGFSAVPYLDTESNWTFGKGRSLETAPLTGAEWNQLLDSKQITVTITRAGADWLEMQQLKSIDHQLSLAYAEWWHLLNDARANAMVEMAYQMGVGGEEAFHDMLGACAEGRWDQAKAFGKQSIWYRKYTTRAERILEQLRTGLWPGTLAT